MSVKLQREIEAKREKITSNPDYFLKRSRRVEAHLRRICDIYSYWLEHPEIRERVLNENHADNGKELKDIVRNGIKRIGNAWDYLKSEGGGSNFIQCVTPSLIEETGRKVCVVNSQGFRTVRVSLGLEYTPPNPVKVPSLVNQFCENLRQSDYGPVESAVFAHLHLAAIQPFLDGNKRTGRLIQDRILHDYGLPPAVIPAGEREVYIDLLNDAFIGIRDNNVKKQRNFFDYVGCQVNVALDEILDDLIHFHHTFKNHRSLQH